MNGEKALLFISHKHHWVKFFHEINNFLQD